jgi:chitodextrinase
MPIRLRLRDRATYGQRILVASLFAVMFGGGGVYLMSNSHAATPQNSSNCAPNAILVNPCRPLIGAAVHGYPNVAKQPVPQFNYLEKLSGHNLDVYRDYDTCSPTGCSNGGYPITVNEKTLAESNVTLDINYKPATKWVDADGGGSNPTSAQQAVNTEIKKVADNVKTLPHKFFMTVWHEPQNNVSAFDNAAEEQTCTSDRKFSGLKGSSGTPAQYIAMWQNVEKIFKNEGVTNVVWAVNYQGAPNMHCLIPTLYPGNSLVNWVLYDTYDHDDKAGTSFDTTAGEVYNTLLADNGKKNALGQTANFDSKPWGLGEFGTCKNPSPANTQQYYVDAKNDFDANKYPRLKMYLVYADTGNNSGYGCLTNYDEDPSNPSANSGALDPTKQKDFNAFFDAILNRGNSTSPTPSITITEPNGGSTVSGSSVSVAANASVSSGSITKLTLSAGGTALKTCTSSPCNVSWNTTKLTNGNYMVSAETTASDGKTNSTSELVTIQNETANCVLSAKLVNPCRPWFGAAVYGIPGGGSSQQSQFSYLEKQVGKSLDFYRQYNSCKSDGNGGISCRGGLPLAKGSDEYYFATHGVHIDVNWKPYTDYADADGGNSVVNAEIAQVAQNIRKVSPNKVMLTVWHEPQSNTNSYSPACPNSYPHSTGGSAAQYVAMWKNVQNIFKQNNVNNVVWAVDYMSTGQNYFECQIPQLWPGNAGAEVDWVLYDVYGTNGHPTWATSTGRIYSYLQQLEKAKPSMGLANKPWGLGEYGTCGSKPDPNAKPPITFNDSVNNARAYYNDAYKDFLNNSYPKIKLFQVWDDNINGNGGSECLTGYDSSTTQYPNGQPDSTKQADFNQFAGAVLGANNEPLSAVITSPISGSTLSGTSSVSINAVGGNGVSQVQLLVNNKEVDSMSVQPYVFPWETTSVPDGTYTLEAKAFDQSGKSAVSPSLKVTVNNHVPIAPTNLLSPKQTAATVNLTWQAPKYTGGSAVSHYLVYRNGIVVGEPNMTSFTDTGLNPKTTYSYSVAAVNTTGHTSQMSNSLSVTTKPITINPDPPSVPSNLKAVAVNSDQINLSWVASTDNVPVAGYRVKRDGKVVATVTGASFGDATAKAGTTYYYQVDAFNSSNQSSAYSSKVKVTTPPRRQPQPTHGVTTLFYPNANFTGKAYVTISPNIATNFGRFSPLPGIIPIHGYGIRWRGRVAVPSSGVYTFFVESYGGKINLSFNNKTVISDKTVMQGGQSVTMHLDAGQYNVKMDYANVGGFGYASLLWYGPGISKALIPESALYPQRFGLRGMYYNNMSVSGTPVIYNLASPVAYDWGEGKSAPAYGVRGTRFSAQWEGYVSVPTSDTYTFYTNTDDGARLWVNNKEVVNEWRDHSLKQYSGTMYVKAGTYPIVMQYYQNKGDDAASLLWSSSTIQKQIIPATDLYEKIPLPTKLIVSNTKS